MKKEIKIALAAILALVVLFFGLNFLKGQKLFSSDELYYVSYGNVSGVERNTPVYADGVKVGRVGDIIYDYSHQKPTLLTIAIDKMMRIPLGSSAEVKSDLMGNTQVNLLLTNNLRERIEPGDTIKGRDKDDTVARLKAMIPTIESMAPKMDSILTSLNAMLSNPAIQKTLANAEVISTDLTKTTKQLNSLMAQLNHDVPSMMKKADTVLDNTRTLTGNLASADVEGTLNRVNQTLASLQMTVDKLNSKEGTVGKLLNDPSLFDNLNATMKHADELVIDLKSNPKRYVHFSIFGKKQQ